MKGSRSTNVRRSIRHHQVATPRGFGESSIVVLDRFIQATRDSGYKSTGSAVSELIDNSVQAGATKVAVDIQVSKDDGSVEVVVTDDGVGMDAKTLRQALRFGGSTRFGLRSGLGRYGMGLPNASLSQARHLIVYTWQHSAGTKKRQTKVCEMLTSYLDVDEILAGTMVEVPTPKKVSKPPFGVTSKSGTCVVWKRCDRLDNRRISTLTRKLNFELGRRFRHFLVKGLRVFLNGERVKPIDPMFLQPKAIHSGAIIFGEPLEYEVCACPTNPAFTGKVRVIFAELPVHDWYNFSNEEKRRIGITKGAGVSIVRAGREVDFGWYFMGTKNRENYDDWWRCEIQFEPVLDEAFGITHTKQQVRPRAHLVEALSGEIESIARTLNGRARKAHLYAKSRGPYSRAEKVATERDHLLCPLPSRPSTGEKALMTELVKSIPNLRGAQQGSKGPQYRIVESPAPGPSFYSIAFDGKQLVLVVNPDHPFYREIYKPLAETEIPRNLELCAKLDLLLLAAARSEVAKSDGRALANHRHEWSNALATFLAP